MVATREKLQDRQSAIITIAAGQTSGYVWLTHNLGVQHNDSVAFDYADPDVVSVEIVDDPSNLSAILGIQVNRPVSPNGTVQILARIGAAQQGDVHFHFNVNCFRFHSIQGDDHTA